MTPLDLQYLLIPLSLIGRYFVKDDSTFSLVYAGAGRLEKYHHNVDPDFIADNHMINHLNYVNTDKIWDRYSGDKRAVVNEIWYAFQAMKGYTLQESELHLKSYDTKINRILQLKKQSH